MTATDRRVFTNESFSVCPLRTCPEQLSGRDAEGSRECGDMTINVSAIEAISGWNQLRGEDSQQVIR
jgi:hypothetical protein